MQRWLAILGMIGAMCGMGCDQTSTKPTGGAANQTNSSDVAPAANAAHEEDQAIEAILAGKAEDGDTAIPVDEFFAKLGDGYALWKGEAEWFKKLAAEAKAAGSPAVYAVVGEAFGVAKISNSFIIALPTDPAARTKVIAAHNNFWKTDWDNLDEEEREELQSEFASDRGQKYLMLSYDP